MKPTAYTLFLLLIFLRASTQSSVNLGGSYGERLNHLVEGDKNNFVIGISAEYTRAFSRKTDLRITTGIEGTDTRITSPYEPMMINYWQTYVIVPVRVGLQRYLVKRNGFLFAEPGLAIGFFPYEELGHADARINLSYAFGAGYRFYGRKQGYLQTSLSFNRNHYNKEHRFSWVNFRVAYGLGWGDRHKR
jgi:hypothetical protein